MKVDVAPEVAASLTSAPGGDCTADQVKAWLFTSQNCVAARLCRILQDKAARDLLTDAAGRTWRRVTDPEGKAQRLWAMMKSTVKHVLGNPESFHPYRQDKARHCLASLAGPVACPEDLIGPGPASAIPHRKELAEWTAGQAAMQDPRILPAPVLGDFCAPNVLNRLYWLAYCVTGSCVVSLRKVRPLPDLRAEVDKTREGLWDTPDAAEITGACAIVQVYLGGTDCRSPNWSLLPVTWPNSFVAAQGPDWPVISEASRLTLATVEASNPGKCEVLIPRRHVFRELLEERLATHPREVANIVKAGLEWLASSLPPAPVVGAALTAKPSSPNLKADLDKVRLRVYVAGNCHELTEAQTKMLSVLFEANGAWVGGKTIGSEPHKTRKAMPPAVARIIQTNKAKGYRIRPESLE